MGRKRKADDADPIPEPTRLSFDFDMLDEETQVEADSSSMDAHDLFSRMVSSTASNHGGRLFTERHLTGDSTSRPTPQPSNSTDIEDQQPAVGQDASIDVDWNDFLGMDNDELLPELQEDSVSDEEEDVLKEGILHSFCMDDLEPRGADNHGEEVQVASEKVPMLEEFRLQRKDILDLLLVLDGNPTDLVCACGEDALYRCTSCFSGRVYCKRCIVGVHATNPFHFVEHWNGRFWEKITLDSLGFVLHMGHNGDPCPRAPQTGRRTHILHTTGVHVVRVVYCNCRVEPGSLPSDRLESSQLLLARLFPATTKQPATAVTFACLNEFHLLTTQGKLTGMDYYETVIHLTDNLGIDPPHKRYDEFMRVARLWRHFKMLKRAAIHLIGLKDAKPGSCAVDCYGCPGPLDFIEDELFDAPSGDPDWVDTLYGQLDANFRLKNKDRGLKNDALNGGLASVVKEGPYKEHLAARGEQTEVNICDSGLHAVDHANLRGSAAYVASGVGACQCRHMLVKPGGVGDLQKGERYSNMDYILASAIRSTTARRIVISYDIACQWHINFENRCKTLPRELGFDFNRYVIEYVIPKFHIAAHGPKCQCRFSLNFRRFMGRTDGENIERGWAWMNPASLSTREMGPGARHDTLDDQWCSWNFRLLTRFGITLFRRLDQAVLQSRIQRREHEQFSSTFDANVVKKWSDMVDAWSEVPFNEEAEDPFREPEPDVTLADVRRQLNDEEAEEVRGGVVPRHAISASKYLATGLQLEDQQRALKARGHIAKKDKRTARGLDAEDKEVELRRKIVQWKRDVQPVYMPNVRIDESSVSDSDDDVGAEECDVWDICLHLPSDFDAEQRELLCSAGLVNKESRLRLAQAEDSLDELRRALRSVTTLTRHQSTQTAGAGVAANTRMLTLISKHKAKVARLADRYRAARAALLKLDPDDELGPWQERLQVLKPEHVKPPRPEDDGPGQGTFHLSWIWLSTSRSGGSGHDDSLRVEWAKSLARAERWEEEAILVPVEMRRILRNLVWKARWWRQTASNALVRSLRIQSGYIAYAEKQARNLEQLAGEFSSQWLSLFAEHNLPTPTGWPHSCNVIRTSARQIKRRRHRTLLRIRALADSGESNDT